MTSTALITGASSGIGLELSLVFAQNKFDLILVARSKEPLQKLKNELEEKYKIKAWVFNYDLGILENCEKLFQDIQREKIEVTHLVNNAGFGQLGNFKNSNWEKTNAMIQLNIASLTYLTHLFLPQFLKQEQVSILNLSSIASFMPGPNMAVYYATKAYVQSFSEALAEELSGTSITVTSLCPGPTKSGFAQAANISKQSPLFNSSIPTSKEVALYAFRLVKNKRRIGIHGLKNNLLVFGLRFLPRKMITKIVFSLQSKRT